MTVNGHITRNPPAPVWMPEGAWRAVSTDYEGEAYARRARRRAGRLRHWLLTAALWLTGGPDA